MTKAQHTELPWKTNAMEVFTDAGKSSKRIAFATGKAQGDDNSLEELKANAEFIVRACNSHYELLEALQETWAHFGDAMSDEEIALKEKSLAAIAKAKGEQQ
ncbi:MAG: hypothetical protein ACXWYM_00435 [Candidatus Binatia bacterium]